MTESPQRPEVGDCSAAERQPAAAPVAAPPDPRATRELGGPAGPEPTRFGDWEKGGRCIDF